MTSKTAKTSDISEEQVRAFLKNNPDFFKKNPDMATELTPPEQNLGGGIIDFQHYLVRNLQAGSKDLRSKYDLLVEFCRDNMSVQHQVHQAALKLIHARNIEQLLEVISLDLVNLFDVDVVRLAMESELPFETAYGEGDFSGIVFVEKGMIDVTMGKKKQVLLIEDCSKKTPPGFEQIFADCDEMIASCALLKLSLGMIDRNVILAFGVRHKGRFHPGQGIELLNFLAQIVGHQLDSYLAELVE